MFKFCVLTGAPEHWKCVDGWIGAGRYQVICAL